MTLKDLQSDVYALGYENPIEKNDAFVSAANQALRVIYAEKKYQKHAKIRVRRTEEASRVPSIRYIGEQLSLPLVGRAYSLRAVGKGKIAINDGRTTKEISFDSDETLIRGFLFGSGTLTLLGDFSFELCDVVTYGELLSDRTDDIPDGSGMECFDFSSMGDFLSFADVARDGNGEEIPDARMEGSCLYIKNTRARDVYVTYNRAPKKIALDDFSLTVDIPREDEAALIFLCASLLWRDDEPELSEHYYESYRELKNLSRGKGNSQSAKYKICDGWT